MFQSKLIKLADFRKIRITDDMCGTPLSETVINEMFDKIAKRNVETIDVEVRKWQ